MIVYTLSKITYKGVCMVVDTILKALKNFILTTTVVSFWGIVITYIISIA